MYMRQKKLPLGRETIGAASKSKFHIYRETWKTQIDKLYEIYL